MPRTKAAPVVVKKRKYTRRRHSGNDGAAARSALAEKYALNAAHKEVDALNSVVDTIEGLRPKSRAVVFTFLRTHFGA